MPGLDRPTRATVSLSAVRANFQEARRRARGRRVIAVVKADAYGHGAEAVARALLAAGCERLAVLSLEEALALREAGVEAPLLVLGGVQEDPELAVAPGLVPALHHRGQLDALARAARGAGRRVRVEVEVDTGMQRMGVPAAEAEALVAAVAADEALVLGGVYTHLARADEPELGPSREQLARLRALLAALRARGIAPPEVHAANSAGLLAGLCEALPEATAVRPGLMLYGVKPTPHLPGRLRPALTLQTRVAHLRSLAAGEPVGYGAAWRAARPTRVATLPLGYADGVPVASGGLASRGGGHVAILGRRFPIVGRVSMDFVGVEVGDAPVAIGDEAIFFGEGDAGRVLVEEAAEAAGTIPYELLVRVGARVPRIFRD